MKFWIPLKDRAQGELLKRGRCVADAKSLAEGEREFYKGDGEKELVTCSCHRVYVYDKKLNSYRRAYFDEVQS